MKGVVTVLVVVVMFLVAATVDHQKRFSYTAPNVTQSYDGVLAWEAYEFTPNTLHMMVYNMVSECIDLGANDFGEIVWRKAHFILDAKNYTRLGGAFLPELNTILLDNQVYSDPTLISHELLHYFMRNENISDHHSDPRFQRCLVTPLY